MQILVASFQTAAERVLWVDKTPRSGRRGGAGVGLGQAAGSRQGPQPTANAFPARPFLGGPGSRSQGAAARANTHTRGPRPSGGAEHQGTLEEGHGLSATGSCSHENCRASADFFLHRREPSWVAPTEGRGRLSLHPNRMRTHRARSRRLPDPPTPQALRSQAWVCPTPGFAPPPHLRPLACNSFATQRLPVFLFSPEPTGC